MSHVIKFRAWDTKYGGFANTREDADYMLAWGTSDCVHVVKNGTPDLENRYVLQQWTGLTDKNGKEIYEGDIVNFTFPFSEDPDEIHEVRWSPGCAGFWIGSSWPLTEGTLKDLNIIGNIYENPELV